MFTIFGDESYDGKMERVFAVGAVFGTAQQWAALQCKWLKRTCGVPIHASDLESDREYFESFSHEENQRLYQDVVTIIAESGIRSYAVSIDIRHIKSLFPAALKYQPYFHCFLETLIGCAERMGQVEREDLEIVFDRHEENERGAGMLYDSLVNTDGWKDSNLIPGRLSFDSHKRYVGLQVADIVARETMKLVDRVQQNNGAPVKARKSLLALHGTRRFHIDHFHNDWLVSLKQYLESNRKYPLTV